MELFNVIPQAIIRANISSEAWIADMIAGVFLGKFASGIGTIVSQIVNTRPSA
jgi:hypothetical protein